MKLKLLIACMVITALYSCKSRRDRIEESNVIDVEYAYENLTTLKVSDFGKTVRYIPLETADDGLVGRYHIVKVLKKYIVIEYQNGWEDTGKCLLFNKEDGSFISEIGHAGQDPMAFSEIFSWADEKEEFLYFQRDPDQLIKYDMKGIFCGKVEFLPFGNNYYHMADYFLINDSEFIGYYCDLLRLRPYALAFFDKEGHLQDSIPPFYATQFIQSVLSREGAVGMGRSYMKMLGNWAKGGFSSYSYRNNDNIILPISPFAARLWKYNDVIRFKEDYVDTLYSIRERKLVPSIVFHTGKYHYTYEEIPRLSLRKDHVFISDVSENNDFVFFQCIYNLHVSKIRPVTYNGLFNKQTGETKIGKLSDGIEDDLTRFMPFNPLGMSTAGEFFSLVEAHVVMEWLEEHPEALANEKLSFLKELDEYSNPVVILVE